MARAKREDQIEEEEIEGGEINLVPYLDIVTNLMLFLLAGLSSAFLLGEINTTLPKHSPAAASQASKPQTKPDEQPIQLVVSVAPKELIVWSISGLEGTLQEPKLRLQAKPGVEGTEGPQFDLMALNRKLYDIASTRWGGKFRKRKTYQLILQADGGIPYETIIEIMDHARRKLPETGMPSTELKYPAMNKDETEFEPYEYNPEVHPLFFDILFSMGFE
ncbi:MAG: biopolymer transporter ExbD [Deltaproteobacteria bacterium]|nr:biopolymer transporter ExbD [Deltaproteobacteria bacterium]